MFSYLLAEKYFGTEVFQCGVWIKNIFCIIVVFTLKALSVILNRMLAVIDSKLLTQQMYDTEANISSTHHDEWKMNLQKTRCKITSWRSVTMEMGKTREKRKKAFAHLSVCL